VRRALLDLLRCPGCQNPLDLRSAGGITADIEHGMLACVSCRTDFPVRDGIPRFVPPVNYADNFGLQWNRFRQTQLDSHTGHPISRKRFVSTAGWRPAELAGKRVLDVGCGAGRFAEIALDCGARVVALDYSSAVDACRDNLRSRTEIDVVQGDIYRLPFLAGQFDFVYCLGVLQHTPDVRRAFLSLPSQLAPGGRLAVDVYPRTIQNLIWPKYWLRPITNRLPRPALFRLVTWMVHLLLPVSVIVGRIPIVGRKLRHFVPVMNYDRILPLDRRQLKEWCLLDTFDMLSPKHDHPQSVRALSSWFREAGLQQIEVFRRGFVIGRGIR
jgi:SAM-dependent methyltransferase